MVGVAASDMDPELELLSRAQARGSLVQQRSRLKGHEKAVTCLSVSTENGLLYSCGEDAIVRAWSLSGSRACQFIFEGHDSPVNTCDLSSDHRLLFTGSNDSTARAWDARRGRELLSFDGHEDSVMSVVESGSTLYTASGDSTIRAWDINTGDERVVFRGHASSVRHVTTAEGVLYSCSWDNNSIAWDARSGLFLMLFATSN